METVKMTVEGLLNDKPIYVRNKSNGDFLLTLYRQDGHSELVPIPKTFIPVLVTNFAEPVLFKRSSDFRRSLAKGIIELIPEKEALKELSKKSSMRELERLRRDEYSELDFSKDSAVTPLEAIQQIGTDNVSLKTRDTITRSDISDEDKLSLLMSEFKSGNLKKEDFEFIIITTDKKSKLAKWAGKRIKDIE